MNDNYYATNEFKIWTRDNNNHNTNFANFTVTFGKLITQVIYIIEGQEIPSFIAWVVLQVNILVPLTSIMCNFF